MQSRTWLFKTLTLSSLIVFYSESYCHAAGKSSTTMPVQVTVVGKCQVTAAQFTFPNYDPVITTDTIGQGTPINVTCALGEKYTIALTTGQNGSYTPNRIMKSPLGTALQYQIYTDQTLSTVWGDGSTGTQTVPGTGTQTIQSIQVNGKITAGQSIPLDPNAANNVYTDSLTVAVSY